MLPLNSDVLLKEIETAEKILASWRERITAGIPGQDLPVSDDRHVEEFIRKLCGELMLVSGKCEVVARVLIEASSS